MRFAVMRDLQMWAAVVCLIFLGGLRSAWAQNDRIRDTETGWGYYYGISSSEILGYFIGGVRPFNISRIAANAYDVVAVANSGSYAIPGATAYFNQTTGSLITLLSNNGQRILDLEPYDNAGATNYAAIVVPNSGATAAPGWGWLAGVTFNDIVGWMNDNPTLRLIDMDVYTVGGQQRYTAVAVPNTGANFQAGWWYASGATEAQVTADLVANNARLIDIEVVSVGTIFNPQVLYSYIMVSDNHGVGVWDGSVNPDQLAALMEQFGTRLTVFQRYVNAIGQTRYAVAGVDNANAHTRRIRDLINANTDGQTGFRLKQVGGPEIAGVNRTFVWEPCSSIKLLHGVYSIWQCAELEDSLSSMVEYRNLFEQDLDQACGLCPFNWTCGPFFYDLETTIRAMLEPSNNNALVALEHRYGVETLEDFATANGFGGITIPRQGCGGCDVLNTATCMNMTTMMEKVADGSLFDQGWQDTLYTLMNDLDEQGYGAYGRISDIIDQEAASTDLTAEEIADFRDRMDFAQKGGSYSCVFEYRTDAGWASIPFKTQFLGNWVVLPRQYTFAVFAHQATSSASNIIFTARDEMLRELIREALATWDAACDTPTIATPPVSITRTEGQNAVFSVTIDGGGDGETYRWQKQLPAGGYADLSDVSGQISGAHTDTLTLLAVDEADAGAYRVRYMCDCGELTSNRATLTVTSPCPADLNNDGSLNFFDVQAFLSAYSAHDDVADWNDDGQFNFFDVQGFLNAYSAGCP